MVGQALRVEFIVTFTRGGPCFGLWHAWDRREGETARPLPGAVAAALLADGGKRQRRSKWRDVSTPQSRTKTSNSCLPHVHHHHHHLPTHAAPLIQWWDALRTDVGLVWPAPRRFHVMHASRCTALSLLLPSVLLVFLHL